MNLVAIKPVVLCMATVTGYAAQHTASDSAPGADERIPCQEVRPELCTMHYDPVCGLLKNGETKIYSNACSACRDYAVSGYRDGVCTLDTPMQRP